MKKVLFFVIIVCLLLVGCSEKVEPVVDESADKQMEDKTPEPEVKQEKVEPKVVEDKVAEKPKKDLPSLVEFDITAKQWSFEPGTIKVKQGDNVRMKVKSVDVTHGIRLPEFGVSETLKSGKTVEINFLADKKGKFSFFCSVQCGSGHGNMKGTLIVE